MMYFGNRRPRGFHHTFIYVDERKDLLRQLQEGRRTETDGPGHTGGNGYSCNGGPGISRRGDGSRYTALRLGTVLVFVLLLMAACMLAMAF